MATIYHVQRENLELRIKSENQSQTIKVLKTAHQSKKDRYKTLQDKYDQLKNDQYANKVKRNAQTNKLQKFKDQNNQQKDQISILQKENKSLSQILEQNSNDIQNIQKQNKEIIETNKFNIAQKYEGKTKKIIQDYQNKTEEIMINNKNLQEKIHLITLEKKYKTDFEKTTQEQNIKENKLQSKKNNEKIDNLKQDLKKVSIENKTLLKDLKEIQEKNDNNDKKIEEQNKFIDEQKQQKKKTKQTTQKKQEELQQENQNLRAEQLLNEQKLDQKYKECLKYQNITQEQYYLEVYQQIYDKIVQENYKQIQLDNQQLINQENNGNYLRTQTLQDNQCEEIREASYLKKTTQRDEQLYYDQQIHLTNVQEDYEIQLQEKNQQIIKLRAEIKNKIKLEEVQLLKYQQLKEKYRNKQQDYESLYNDLMLEVRTLKNQLDIVEY